MQSFYNFITYIFSPVPPREFHYYIPLAVLAAILVAVSVYIYFHIKKNKEDKTFKRLFRSYPLKFETVAAVIAICLLSRYYGVVFLSTRILLFITLVVAAYLIYKMVRTYLKDYPAVKKHYHEQMEKNKYLPRRKNK